MEKKLPKKKHSIARRFPILNIVFFAAMAIVLVLLGNFIILNITSTASQDYARFHSLEAVNKLNVYLNPEVKLIDKIAESGKLKDWFADEFNIEKKIAAYEELFIYGDILSSSELYFVIHNSLNEYSVDAGSGITFDDLMPFDIILPEIEYNQWYYRCIASVNAYELNIDIDKVTDERRLWINHKVEDDGEILGVFCSGLRFDNVINDLFRGRANGGARTLIINENGIIQIDSALLDRDHSLPDEEEIHISALISNPEFLSAIEAPFTGARFFTSEDEPVIFRMAERRSYLSLAPIADTNWMVVTLFNPEALFDTTRLQPLLITVFAVLIAYVIFISLLSDKMFLTPFRKLLKSLDQAWIDGVYGYDLKNEFGEVFKTIEHTRMLLDMTPMSCTLWDKNMTMISCNQESLKLFGLKNKNEFSGKFYDFSPEFQPCGRNSVELGNEWMKTAFDEGFFRSEWVHQLPNGEFLPCEITLVRYQHRDEYVVASYARDLREHKAYLAEMDKAHEELRLSQYAAEQASKAKSEFLAVMSHEIRTPMNSILGFAELALDGNSLPQIKDYLRKISESTKWLLNIINDILDISKIESGKIELEYAPFDLQDIVSRCQSVILPEVKKKELELRVYLDPLPGKRLMGDAVRLYQVIMNLLSNAVKFTDTGVVKLSSLVKSSAGNTAGNTAAIYFEVKDSGIGITPGQTEKIFDPFVQGDSSTTRSYGGTGLGLPIASNIIQLMGGKLNVESSPGEGSTFSFEIEFNTVDASAEMFDLIKSGVFESIIEKPRFEGLILICDDNSMNQEVICEHLDQVGIRTVVADNGRLGVEKVAERMHKNEKPFDLIFMDIFMPVMDGIEAAQNIIKLNTGTPIAAMTANVMKSELEKYRKAGMIDCLSKPFTSQELWRILLKYFRPVSKSKVDLNEQDALLKKMLQINFVKNYQSKYSEIVQAIESGDIILAHRLVHTLKGNAGMIGKIELQDIAKKIELMLKDGTIPPAEDMDVLQTQLKLALDELNPLLDTSPSQEKIRPITAEQVLALFDKLEPMLEKINPECIKLLDEVRAVPGAEELARQIEDFDFESASWTLDILKKRWM